jgi:hypothetical protein
MLLSSKRIYQSDINLSIIYNEVSDLCRLELVHQQEANLRLTIPELRRGARTHGEPQPPFTVAAKTEGVTPGFGIRDEPRAGRLRVLRMIGR